ncbi:MAG: hypothetical protein QOF78_1385 [Phycisphaerales bacterium]|nr:hypothetical protein [Phycisphaerales bacterium]
MAQIRCSHCGQTYELTPEQVPQYAGQTITCTNCKQPFTVPADQGAGGAGAGTYAAAGSAAQPTAYPQQQQQYQPPPGTPPYPGAGGAAAVGYGGYQPAQGQGANGLAVASLVLGIIGIFVPILPGIVAIILGIVALNKTRDPRVGGRGLAIAGISVGAISMIISVGCMASILLPSLGRARETANRVKCNSNMRQIGLALLLYGNDNRGVYPPDFPPLLLTQDITSEVFVCPSSNDTKAPGATAQEQAPNLHKHCSYVYLPGGTTSSSAEAVLAYEPMSNHDGDGANFLFGDGHVAWESKQTAAAMIKSLEAGQNPPTTR